MITIMISKCNKNNNNKKVQSHLNKSVWIKSDRYQEMWPILNVRPFEICDNHKSDKEKESKWEWKKAK